MDDNLVFVTVTEGSYPKKLAFTYLDDVRKEFQGSYKREDYLDPGLRPYAYAEFERFLERTGAMPNMNHAGTYSAVTQYLKAIEAAGTDETEAVAAKLHEMPVNDFFAKDGKVLPNGRMVSDVYLMQVKAPGESEIPWDYYDVVATIPGDQAYLSAEESGCPLVTQ